jgi:hypothetical protein
MNLVFLLPAAAHLAPFPKQPAFFVAFHASLSGPIASLFPINVVGLVLRRQVVLRAMGVSAALSTFVSGCERLTLALIGGLLAVWEGMFLAGSHLLDDLFKGLPIVPMIVALMLVGVGVLQSSRSSFEKDICSGFAIPRESWRFRKSSGFRRYRN